MTPEKTYRVSLVHHSKTEPHKEKPLHLEQQGTQPCMARGHLGKLLYYPATKPRPRQAIRTSPTPPAATDRPPPDHASAKSLEPQASTASSTDRPRDRQPGQARLRQPRTSVFGKRWEGKMLRKALSQNGDSMRKIFMQTYNWDPDRGIPQR